MIQVFQAEWCPYSAMLRERLTELGVDYVSVRVEPQRRERAKLKGLTGDDSIPAVILEDGTVLTGATEDIVARLGEVLDAWEHQEGHVQQAVAHGVDPMR